MRGRATNNTFIEQFVIDCAANNKTTVKDIRKEAIKILSEIDEQIKKAEQLKKTRTKYIDVLDIIVPDDLKSK